MEFVQRKTEELDENCFCRGKRKWTRWHIVAADNEESVNAFSGYSEVERDVLPESEFSNLLYCRIQEVMRGEEMFLQARTSSHLQSQPVRSMHLTYRGIKLRGKAICCCIQLEPAFSRHRSREKGPRTIRDVPCRMLGEAHER